MNITYKTAVDKQQALEFCKIAKSHRLFVPGWNLNADFNSVVNGYLDPLDVEITLAYDGDKPIAVAFKENAYIQCFVRANYRRKGIGSEIIKPHMQRRSYAYVGLDISRDFWAKNKVPCLS